MNRISSLRLSTRTWVRWQCSQNISWVSKGLVGGPNGGSGEKFEGGLGINVGSCGGKGGRGGLIAQRGGGSLAKRSMESKDVLGGGGFVVLGGRSSSESKRVLGEEGGVKNKMRVLEKLWGKMEVKYLRLLEEPFDNRWVVIEGDKEGTPIKGWRNNKDEY
ncbi:hypothetical protein Tco_1456151 [Tanacetum coccineum]